MTLLNRRAFLDEAAQRGVALAACVASDSSQLAAAAALAEPGRTPRRYVYWTKSLQALDVPGLIAFCHEVGVAGVDLAVRPGYPVNPDNARSELPKAARAFRQAGLVIGLATFPVNLADPSSALTKPLLEAAGAAGVPAVKIGYFPYIGDVDAALAEARRKLAAWAKLAAQTGVKVCYHTHSGNYLGNNAAGLRLLLQDLDPRHVGAYLDTGHVAVNGGPIRMELDLVRPWLSLLAIKDMRLERHQGKWQWQVVPVGDGIVRWEEVGAGLQECSFQGTISVHAEYETRSLAERKELAKRELSVLRKALG
jgi:sugar phosphate isomerase/epimerase